MGLVRSILAEIEQESRTTRRVLERVPTDKLRWKPHEKSSSLGRLAWHIAAIPSRVLAMMRAGDFDMAAAPPLEPPDSTEGSIPRAASRYASPPAEPAFAEP